LDLPFPIIFIAIMGLFIAIIIGRIIFIMPIIIAGFMPLVLDSFELLFSSFI